MNKKIIIPIVVVVIIVALLAAIRECVYQQVYCNEMSAWKALDASILVELDEYRRKNLRYSDSLEELDVKFSDGASREMLNQIEYEANGISCQYNYRRKASKRNTTILTEVELGEGKRHYNETITPVR